MLTVALLRRITLIIRYKKRMERERERFEFDIEGGSIRVEILCLILDLCSCDLRSSLLSVVLLFWPRLELDLLLRTITHRRLLLPVVSFQNRVR